jgi:hypothetical protein
MKQNLSVALASAFMIVSILHLLLYASAQQEYRQAANDAPRLMADQLAARAATGKAAQDLFGNETAILSAAHGIYGLVCNPAGTIMGSNLAAAPAAIPEGLTAQASKRGVHYVTWATRGGRYALVLRAVPGTTLFAGGIEPLRNTEQNVMRLWQMVLVSWIGCSIVLAFAGAILFRRFSSVTGENAATRISTPAASASIR